jgi:hypothetical protein
MAFAGKNPDGVAGVGQFQNASRQNPADFLDHRACGLARGPGSAFPLAHLFHGDDGCFWQWSSFVSVRMTKLLTFLVGQICPEFLGGAAAPPYRRREGLCHAPNFISEFRV